MVSVGVKLCIVRRGERDLAWSNKARETASATAFCSPDTWSTKMSMLAVTRMVTAILRIMLNSGRQRREEKMLTTFMLSVLEALEVALHFRTIPQLSSLFDGPPPTNCNVYTVRGHSSHLPFSLPSASANIRITPALHLFCGLLNWTHCGRTSVTPVLLPPAAHLLQPFRGILNWTHCGRASVKLPTKRFVFRSFHFILFLLWRDPITPSVIIIPIVPPSF